MGTKRAVAFSVIFKAHIEKWLPMASPYKPLVWKRFIDDIFSLWDISTKEVYKFVDFANTFHPSNIKFTWLWNIIGMHCFSWYWGFKGTLPFNSTLNLQTHFKPIETFQYTHFLSCHLSNCKKGKGGTLCLLRTNSVRENFEHRLCQTGYPLMLVKEILTVVNFTNRKGTLRNKTKQTKGILPFLLLPTIWPHRISKRFSWNTGTSSNSNLSSNKICLSLSCCWMISRFNL